MTEIMLEATGIRKVLGDDAGRLEVLKGIDLSLGGGELTLLMGPSGSGKTTLLSVLGCMLTPTIGTVQIRGRSTTGLGPEELAKLRRENVGFVFQSYHLFPTLTAAENVHMALDVRGVRSAQARSKAEQALETVGLAHKAKSFPRALSGGEQQRVAIARAIVGNPSLVLADEPTAALDSESGQAIMTLLADIAKDPNARCSSSRTIHGSCLSRTASCASKMGSSSVRRLVQAPLNQRGHRESHDDVGKEEGLVDRTERIRHGGRGGRGGCAAGRRAENGKWHGQRQKLASRRCRSGRAALGRNKIDGAGHWPHQRRLGHTC